MGALIAAVDKKDSNISDAAITMLEMLSHRGSDAFGIASPHRTSIKSTVEELQKEHIDSNALIGHNFGKTLSKDKAQPVQNRDFTLVFEGRLFPAPAKNEAEYVINKLINVENKAVYLLQNFNGAYCFAIAKDDEAVVGRDTVGTCPLYFGENEDICVVASERKALWKIGVIEANSFPPGKLAVINKKGFCFKTVKTITQPPLQKVDMKTAAQQLKQVLLKSTKERVSDVKDVAVAFSGGIDSSIIAFLAKLCHVNVHLVCVALEGQKETAFAERAARTLGLPFHYVAYSIDDVKETLPKILWLIEEPKPVNASIATPIFWVAEQSAKLGFRVLMAGQGGDELFGGYHRYLEDYARHGLVGLQRRLYQDVVSSNESNFQRDNKVCAFHKVELRLPFADWKVIQLALSLPADLKIASSKDALRKRVLRQAARKLGIPKFITDKPKKAIQYTTGVNQTMRKLAKKEGLTLRKYVEKTFLKTYKMLE
ncbi:MAG: asparagine synthetase B [Candidatus Bathyarchaeota archaeon]|nr:asparagine synthetase B [Candidatus Bathyarchaeota archaeon]MDH5495004.1 asparagine synthetase B [Candidatus Bathyarchaeota archaeon]